MNLLSIFKTDVKGMAAEEFKNWAKKCTVEKLDRYVRSLGTGGKEFDYVTYNGWGHAFSVTETYAGLIHFGNGFYTTLINTSNPKAGDYLRLKNAKGSARYIILHIRWERDPRDMFWAYVVGLNE